MSYYFGNGKSEVIGYTYADIAGDLDSRKSTFGYLVAFFRGSNVMVVKAT